MNEYAGAIAGWRPNLKSFKQLMVFSSTWSLGLNSFIKHYMTDPVIVITAPLEAAVYAHIKWVGQSKGGDVMRCIFRFCLTILSECIRTDTTGKHSDKGVYFSQELEGA